MTVETAETPDLRDEWRCDGCRVAVYVPGKKIPRPRLWQSDDECNQCWVRATGSDEDEIQRREQVRKRGRKKGRKPAKMTGEAAFEWKRTKQQRKGPRKRQTGTRIERAEAELVADPSRSNREIADLVGLSGQAGVRSARRRLGISPPNLDRRGQPIKQAEPS